MPTEPNTPQPVIPFKMPHLTPVLDGPSPLVPESAAFMNHQLFLTEKANLEFVPVKARSLEQRARLVYVRAQCEELEKVVVLERMVAQIAQLRQEIKALKALRRKPGQLGARTRKERLADREAIRVKQAEISKLEEAQARLSCIAQVTQLPELTRNQFLKMVGMTVLATVVWNRAVAAWKDIVNTDTMGASCSLGWDNFSTANSASKGSYYASESASGSVCEDANPETRYGDWGDSDVEGEHLPANNGFQIEGKENFTPDSASAAPVLNKLFYELELNTKVAAFSGATRTTWAGINTALTALPNNSVSYLMISGHTFFSDQATPLNDFWLVSYPTFVNLNQSAVAARIKSDPAYQATVQMYRVLAPNAVLVLVGCFVEKNRAPILMSNSLKPLRVKVYSENYDVFWFNDKVYFSPPTPGYLDIVKSMYWTGAYYSPVLDAHLP